MEKGRTNQNNLLSAMGKYNGNIQEVKRVATSSSIAAKELIKKFTEYKKQINK